MHGNSVIDQESLEECSFPWTFPAGSQVLTQWEPRVWAKRWVCWVLTPKWRNTNTWERNRKEIFTPKDVCGDEEKEELQEVWTDRQHSYTSKGGGPCTTQRFGPVVGFLFMWTVRKWKMNRSKTHTFKDDSNLLRSSHAFTKMLLSGYCEGHGNLQLMPLEVIWRSMWSLSICKSHPLSNSLSSLVHFQTLIESILLSDCEMVPLAAGQPQSMMDAHPKSCILTRLFHKTWHQNASALSRCSFANVWILCSGCRRGFLLRSLAWSSDLLFLAVLSVLLGPLDLILTSTVASWMAFLNVSHFFMFRVR